MHTELCPHSPFPIYSEAWVCF